MLGITALAADLERAQALANEAADHSADPDYPSPFMADAVEASAAGGALAALRRDVDELRAHRAEAVSSEAEARGVRSAFAGWVGARAPGL